MGGVQQWNTRLKAMRREAGLSQTSLALAAGVSQSLVAHWERGTRYPTPEQQQVLRDLVISAGQEAPVSEIRPFLALFEDTEGAAPSQAFSGLRRPVRRRVIPDYVGGITQGGWCRGGHEIGVLKGAALPERCPVTECRKLVSPA